MPNLTLQQTLMTLFHKEGMVLDAHWTFNDPEGSQVAKPSLGFTELVLPAGSKLQQRSSSVVGNTSGIAVEETPLHLETERRNGRLFLWVALEGDNAFLVSKSPPASSNTYPFIIETNQTTYKISRMSTCCEGIQFDGSNANANTYLSGLRDKGFAVTSPTPQLRKSRIGLIFSGYHTATLTDTQLLIQAAKLMRSAQQALNPLRYTGESMRSYLNNSTPQWAMVYVDGSGEDVTTQELVPVRPSLEEATQRHLATEHFLVKGVKHPVTSNHIALMFQIGVTRAATQPVLTAPDPTHTFYCGAVLNATVAPDTYTTSSTGDAEVGADVLVKCHMKTHVTDGTEFSIEVINGGVHSQTYSANLPEGLGVITSKSVKLEITHDPDNDLLTVDVYVDLVKYKTVSVVIPTLLALTSCSTIIHRKESHTLGDVPITNPILWEEVPAQVGYQEYGSGGQPAAKMLVGTGTVPSNLWYNYGQGTISTLHSNRPINAEYLPPRGVDQVREITNCSGMGITTGAFTVFGYLTWDANANDVPTTYNWNGTDVVLENPPLFYIKPSSGGFGVLVTFNKDRELVVRIDIHTAAKDIVIPNDKVPTGQFFALFIIRDDSGAITVYLDGQAVVTGITVAGNMGLDLPNATVTRHKSYGYSTTPSYCFCTDIAIYDRAMPAIEVARFTEVSGGSITGPSALEGGYEGHPEGTAVAFREDTGELLLSGPITSGRFSLPLTVQGDVVLALFADADTTGAGSLVKVALGAPLPPANFIAPDGATGTHKVEGSTYDSGAYVSAKVRVYRADTFIMLAEVTSDATTGGYLAKFDYTGSVLVTALINNKINVTPNLTPIAV